MNFKPDMQNGQANCPQARRTNAPIKAYMESISLNGE
jgi:hypothetical protein